MRILIASDHYPPFVGGAQRQTKVLADELHARGHAVSVATVWQDDQLAVENLGGVRVHRLRQLRTVPGLRGTPRRRHQPPFADPVTTLGLRRLIHSFQPDVVHAAGWYTFAAAAALRSSDVPLVVSARDYGFSCATTTLTHHESLCSGPALGKCLGCAASYYGAPRGWIATGGVFATKRQLRRRMDALHSVSRFVDEMTVRDVFNGDAGDIPRSVIGSFRVEQDVVATSTPPPELPDEPFILFVGALRRVKGIHVLLAAYEQLVEPPPLVLLGTREDDTPPQLPNGVTIIDAVPNAMVLAAWDRALFGVMPSLWPEPFGSVVHEAMSRGRPVIGTRPGGHEDMIDDGKTGLLVPAGDVEALRDAMTQLISSAAVRERLGQAARRRAAEFTASSAIPRFEQLYEEAIARRRD